MTTTYAMTHAQGPAKTDGAPVHLEYVPGYAAPGLARTVADLLEGAGFTPEPGARVLVKPNLVAPKNMGLSCTHPGIVRAACEYLLDLGAKVTVGDSPAFGASKVIARLSGLTEALSGLPVRMPNFSRSRRIKLSFGKTAAVASEALSADMILNMPRLKAHDQMGMTAAVKNLFGCVTGFRKSLAHQLYGEKENRFERLIIEVMQSLPETFSLLDGVVAMHKAGPVGGEPFHLGLLAASANPVALDTAVYAMLGLTEDKIPLWREARVSGLPGAFAEEIMYPLKQPGEFAVKGFQAPQTLTDVAFHPKRFLQGRLKSLLVRFR